jgi:dihydropyrimidinase
VKTLIRNGLLCFEDRVERADLLIRNGTIEAVAPHIAEHADSTVEAEGAYVLPGLIDAHTHIGDRIGPFELADDYRSGTQIAVENGITTIATFVTESAGRHLEDAVCHAQQRAENNSYADYWWHLTPIRFDQPGWEAINRLVSRGFRSFKFYTTYKAAGIYSDYDQLEWMFERMDGQDVQFLVHCEDDEILNEAQRAADVRQGARTHALSRPPRAEIVAIREVLRRAVRYTTPVHIVHVSTPGGLDLIDDARASLRVTCETCPQYLFLDESWLAREDGYRWLCSPPLRGEEMRSLMADTAANGMVDLFATDHCAFTKGDKDLHRNSIVDVPNGIAGIGALPHLIYSLYAQRSHEPMKELARRLSANPARLLGAYPRKGSLEAGADADLSLCRVGATTRALCSSHADTYESYPGMQSPLVFESVYLRGHEVARGGQLLYPDRRRGESLWRV